MTRYFLAEKVGAVASPVELRVGVISGPDLAACAAWLRAEVPGDWTLREVSRAEAASLRGRLVPAPSSRPVMV